MNSSIVLFKASQTPPFQGLEHSRGVLYVLSYGLKVKSALKYILYKEAGRTTRKIAINICLTFILNAQETRSLSIDYQPRIERLPDIELEMYVLPYIN